MIQAKVNPENRNGSTTHYVAGWVQDGCQVRCFHQHKTLSEAAVCIPCPDGFVKAVTDGRERSLTYEEQEVLVRTFQTLFLAERNLSRQDDKTGILNERGFREVLAREISRSRRHPHPLTVVYLDLDGFKAVNDALGHSTGNVVLKVVAETIKRSVRQVDFVARLHGDEFALLFPDANAENARSIVGKLRAVLADTMKAHEWNITFSIGVVTFRTPRAAPDYMIDEADKAMYTVKRSGRNRVSTLVRD